MKAQWPVLDVLIRREGPGWKMYAAPFSWSPGMLSMDDRSKPLPVRAPDVADLDQFMWDVDSPYERHPTADGGIEIRARGRSAVTLAVWLGDLVEAGRRCKRTA